MKEANGVRMIRIPGQVIEQICFEAEPDEDQKVPQSYTMQYDKWVELGYPDVILVNVEVLG